MIKEVNKNYVVKFQNSQIFNYADISIAQMILKISSSQ